MASTKPLCGPHLSGHEKEMLMTDTPEQEPKVEVLGIEIDAIEEHLRPVEVIVIAKVLDMNDGKPGISLRASEGLSTWEAMGIVHLASLWIEEDAVYEGRMLDDGGDDDSA